MLQETILPKRRRVLALAFTLPLALAACAQQQQVYPGHLVAPDPTFSKLGDRPVPAE